MICPKVERSILIYLLRRGRAAEMIKDRADLGTIPVMLALDVVEIEI